MTDQKYRIIPFVYSGTEAYSIIITAETANSKIIIIRASDLTVCSYSRNLARVDTFGGYTSEAELDEISFSQSGDIMILCHKNHPPLVIARTGPTVFLGRSFTLISESIATMKGGFTNVYVTNSRGFPFLPVNC